MRTLFLLFSLLFGGVYSLSAAEKAERGFVEVNGARLYYESVGEGTPLIFVHGHSLDRRMWDEQVAFFRQHYRVIVYDARGYGRSSKQREEELFTHADDLVALMDRLGVERAHLVGLSMGGFIVGDLVAMYPERLLTATMAEGVIRSTPSINEPMTVEEIAKKNESIEQVKRQGVRRYKRTWFAQLMRGGSQAERMRRPLWRQIRAWDCWQPLHHEVHCYYAREAMQVLQAKRPTVPCLYIRAWRPNEQAPRAPKMMEYTPNARFVAIEDSGHMCNMEQPLIFNQKVLEFLTEYQQNND